MKRGASWTVDFGLSTADCGLSAAPQNGPANRSTSARTSASDRFRPSANAYAVSQYEQRRLQAVSRTKTHGSPANVLSPCRLK